MTSFVPDVNIWLALSVDDHSHGPEAWQWLRALALEDRLHFCRYSQLGLLRLLTNSTVMGPSTLTLIKAWDVFDGWVQDPRVDLRPEPLQLDRAFRLATSPFWNQPASKWVGDCYLLAFAQAMGAVLVTFDKGLVQLARKADCPVVTPS